MSGEIFFLEEFLKQELAIFTKEQSVVTPRPVVNLVNTFRELRSTEKLKTMAWNEQLANQPSTPDHELREQSVNLIQSLMGSGQIEGARARVWTGMRLVDPSGVEEYEVVENMAFLLQLKDHTEIVLRIASPIIRNFKEDHAKQYSITMNASEFKSVTPSNIDINWPIILTNNLDVVKR